MEDESEEGAKEFATLPERDGGRGFQPGLSSSVSRSTLLVGLAGTLSLCFHGGRIAAGAREDRR